MKKKLSLRSQVIIVFVGFVIVVLGMVFIFQNYFLNDFYSRNKINILKRTGNLISENITNEDLDSYLDDLTLNQEVCVRIVSNDLNLQGYSKSNVCVLSMLNSDQLSDIAYNVQENGGNKLFDNYRLMGPNRDDLYIYGEITEYNNSPALVLVSSLVMPLDATVRTINDQYKVIVAIVIIATILMALIVSKLLIKPINSIKEEATHLPLGNYDGTCIKTNNQEIEDLNETLIIANKEISKADRVKKELMANVSHDLRTPLTMIIGYGEMIKEMPNEDVESNATIIIDEAKRLSALVDDLMDVSKFDNDQFTLNKENVSLNALLESVFFQYEKYFESQNVKSRLIKLDKDITINIDEKRIKQVLYNFINNALNYNDKKNKELTLGVEKIKNKYRIYVLDNGSGIKSRDLKKIWDRYYKVDKEHSRAHLGSGIGLSLSSKILEASSLKYGVESKINEYSKFYFDVEKV